MRLVEVAIVLNLDGISLGFYECVEVIKIFFFFDWGCGCGCFYRGR